MAAGRAKNEERNFFSLRFSFFILFVSTSSPRYSRLRGLFVAKKVDGIARDLYTRLLLDLFN